MNVVLYTTDFEPITVLDLPIWLLDQLERVGAVRVAVQSPIKVNIADTSWSQPWNIDDFKTVTIYCEKLRWRDNTVKPILITPDEELAMLLKPEWLPGQRSTINGMKQTVRLLTDQLIKAMRK